MEPNTRQRGVIKRDQVRLDEREARVAHTSSASETCAPAPAVRLVRVDEHTQAFEFTCSCGEVSLVEIQYEKKP